MTITEKILASHAGVEKVVPGDLIMAKVDLALGNDITAPIAIDVFEEAGAKEVFDRDRVVLVCDHFTPNKDIKSAAQCKRVREFAVKMGIAHIYEGGNSGVEHALLPELGLVHPGDLIIGADSHTCTYGGLAAFATGVGSTDLAAAMITGEVWLKVPESMKFVFHGTPKKWVTAKDFILHAIGDIGVDGALYRAMEFTGPAVSALTIEGRLTMANMAIEAGGKNGIFEADEKTIAYIKGTRQKTSMKNEVYKSDPDAEYVYVREYDAGNIPPLVAMPHLPSNVRPVEDVGNIEIDQVVIGSCTNGRIEDLRLAAEILRGRRANRNVRLIVIPATPAIYRQAMNEGLFEVFLDADGVISPPTCGPCLGGHMGVLAAGERAVATTNRNFAGRMGDPKSEVYLASPAVAAASAVLGRVAGPADLGL
ncbi:MAG: 3-isopropylmalate dehydratase large subunit [Deltaproteobacteria bacterium]|uniref:3-isopropylmalate dehydratase large subunit n=1 Tax=Candidatus Zymogenus saltonus TaxID=2844893 RepID=A0A9D8K8W7_9DELT|nr:3-isopropylmalate dehydratase large subunit [Candidatus Zymogenus saltonus]